MIHISNRSSLYENKLTIVGETPGTAASAAGAPLARALTSAVTEEGGSPALMAAAPMSPESDASLELMIAFKTADPKAPPMARAEKASPVAVDWRAVSER